MDPISKQKKEQPKEGVVTSSEYVRSTTPESAPEVEVAEIKEEKMESLPEEEKEIEQTEPIAEKPLPPPPVSVAIQKPKKDKLTEEIEDIFEEDLKELYLAMPKDRQKQFRLKGEETLILVRGLVSAAHVNVKKIFQLICEWLKLIPGVNRYFLEQEAKIKADKILIVSEEEKRRGL